MKIKVLYLAVFSVLAFEVIGCARPSTRPPIAAKKAPPYEVDGKIYYPLGEVGDYVERGIASWYGEEFHGRKTSSGEIYDMYARTAAHRILPFGTQVQVTNVTNGKKTTVRINDRGPFVNDRIIDLSYTGARDIGLVGPGTALVELQVVGPAGSAPLDWPGNFVVQIGAFEEPNNAALLKERLSLYYPQVFISTFDTRGKLFYRVRVGKFHILQEAIRAQKELEAKGYQDTFVVAE